LRIDSGALFSHQSAGGIKRNIVQRNFIVPELDPQPKKGDSTPQFNSGIFEDTAVESERTGIGLDEITNVDAKNGIGPSQAQSISSILEEEETETIRPRSVASSGNEEGPEAQEQSHLQFDDDTNSIQVSSRNSEESQREVEQVLADGRGGLGGEEVAGEEYQPSHSTLQRNFDTLKEAWNTKRSRLFKK
jgi:hypothetical protein